jgi:hypothetical protein
MQTILEILILLFLLYLAFFKSYFQEKGKNLATKEDIEDITSVVESIKTELQFSLQAKLSLRAEEHQALVDYFSKYSVWLSAIRNWSAAGINKDNTSRLAEIRSQLDVLHQDFDLAAGKLMLFVENEEIQSQHGPLAIETLKLQAHANQASFDIGKTHLETEQMLLVTPQDQKVAEYGKLLEKEKAIYKRHKEEQIEMYKALLPLVRAQQQAISKHIRALADGQSKSVA